MIFSENRFPLFRIMPIVRKHRLDRMAPFSRERIASLIRGIGVRQIRLACGLVLFAYLVSHFFNHALGNISSEALGAGLYYHMMFWQFPPVALAFYAAALVHTGLGISALYKHREFRWKAIEPLQLVLGLSVPALIIGHISGVRLGQALFGLKKLYPQVFYVDWVVAPSKMWLLLLVLVIAWVHGCIGLYFWLRMKAFYKRAAPFLLAAAVLVPTLSMLGLYQGGRHVVRDATGAEWRENNLSRNQVGTPAEQAVLDSIVEYFLIGYLGLIGLVLVGKGVRALNDRRSGTITLSYGNGRKVRVQKGLSVLEASLRHNVPHASVCGGRARCSTCRIRIIGDYTSLPEPSKREAFVLNRVGEVDPSVRLACQLRPTTDLSFFQVVAPQAMPAHIQASQANRVSQERYLVSLFVDMRDSTKLAEHRLPFDTVFIVNRFLGAVSQAVIECGGQPNQFVGDGALALFGLGTNPRTASRQALKAAAMIAANVEELNRFIAHDLQEPIRFGIGIHGGEVIIGDIGYRDHMVFTALGDAVNVAARLQEMTKSLSCEVMLSEELHVTAGLAADSLPQQEVDIRGRAKPMVVRCVANAKMLSALVDEADVAAV
jgi:adenylate cyclase